jgi:hypothetical protein
VVWILWFSPVLGVNIVWMWTILPTLATIVPTVNISSMFLWNSGRVSSHILRTCNRKIILMNSLNFCAYFCRS